MRITSLFSNRPARLLTLLIIVVGLIAGAGLFVEPTLSCPVAPPRPLRSLYVQSERIVIAHIGKTEIVMEESNDDDDDSDDNESTQLKTALLVSSTLKGEHQPVVYVRHYSWGDYKDKLSSASADDTLLVFLTRSPDTDDYDVDMEYGLKILSDADLKVYVSRIEELASMMKAGQPGDSEIVQWLVRCAEEPATRWEGTYELYMSQLMLEQKAEENVSSETIEISEVQTAEQSELPEEIREVVIQTDGFESEWTAQVVFAKLLTSDQKYRLGTVLTNVEALTANDYFLMELVKRWDDPRLVPYLLAQLDRISKPGEKSQSPLYFVENLMTIVANKLGDDALRDMVKRFSENVSNQTNRFVDYVESAEDAEDEAEVDVAQEEAEAAEAVLFEQRLNTELQYFVTLASSTVPKAPNEESPVPVVTEEP